MCLSVAGCQDKVNHGCINTSITILVVALLG